MTDQITLIPLTAIWSDALPRDRTAVMIEQSKELATSIATDGLRLPVELYKLDQDPDCPPPDPDDPEQAEVTYGLISGSRRVAAFFELNADNPDQFTHIPALIRPFTNRAEAMRHVIAENDLHAAIFPWDIGHVINQCRATGIFDTIDSAITGLFPNATPTKRTRLRAFAHVVGCLGDAFTIPQGLSQNKMLRLAAGLRDNWTDLILTGLRDSVTENPDRQWAIIEPILSEAESELKETTHVDPRSGRPRRTADIRQGVRLRREKTQSGYAIHFSGNMVTSAYMDDIIDQLEIWFGRRE
ncbi:MAG: hypothetical protein ABI459_03815 [Deltaproteobacteria bacterium]